MKYCTYLTSYRGNKLPPFYIGYTTMENIEKGYRGSPQSKEYKNTFKDEIENNGHLFKTQIISIHETQKEALEKEAFFQETLNVVPNEMYINKRMGAKFVCVGPKSLETKKKMSLSHTGMKKPWRREAMLRMWETGRMNVSKGYRLSEETKRKMSEAKKKMTAETKEKLRQAALRQHERNRDQ